MKCPNCEGGVKIIHTIVGGYRCGIECSDCRGTGVIQKGDYWEMDTGAVLYWGGKYWSSAKGFPPMTRADGKQWTPISRLERVK